MQTPTDIGKKKIRKLNSFPIVNSFIYFPSFFCGMDRDVREQGREQDIPREESAIVLDFLTHGYPTDMRPSHRKTAIAQALGKTHLSLLELVPKEGVFLQPLEEVYIGGGLREKVHHILGRIDVSKLTATARTELEFVLKDLVKKDEKRFVQFFNMAQPLTMRMHQLELLPGIGKKCMWEVLEARSVRHFSSYADIKERVKLLPDPEKLVVRRLLSEIEGNEKHKLFVQ